jgi:hypothetical protein
VVAGTRVTTWIVIGLLILIVLLIVYAVYRIVRLDQVRQERSGRVMDYGHLIVVTLGMGAVLVVFLVTMFFTEDLFQKSSEVLAVLTALFGVIGTLVGTYFGIKASSDAREGAQELAATGVDTTQPLVSLTTPPDRAENVSPDIHPTATFSKEMDSVSINPDTFKLLYPGERPEQVKARVSDGVVYDEATRVATFTPEAPLHNATTYAATITASVKDKAGNTLAQDHTWHFTVNPKGE